MTSKSNIVAVIPARYASQRLPAKPLFDLLGKSMVQRVYEQAKKASLPTRVVVATDDERIRKVVQSFGGEVVMTSPDIRSGTDRVAAVAGQIPGDIFANVQGDEPLMSPEMIDEGVRVLLDDTQADVGTLAKRIESEEELLNPGIVKVVLDRHGYALYFSRSIIPHVRDEKNPSIWLKRGTFLKHIGLYVYRRDFLGKYAQWTESTLERLEKLEQLRVLENGYRIKVGMTSFDSIPVDTREDAGKVVRILKQSSS